jgi:hypothetical protein
MSASGHPRDVIDPARPSLEASRRIDPNLAPTCNRSPSTSDDLAVPILIAISLKKFSTLPTFLERTVMHIVKVSIDPPRK